MAELLQFPVTFWIPDPDEQLVAGDAAVSLEAPAKQRLCLAFDDTDEEAAVTPEFQMPDVYTGSGLKAKIHGFFKTETTVTSEAVMEIWVEAETPGAGSIDKEAAEGFDAANSVEIDPDGTAGYAVEATVTLTNADSVAAGDTVRLGIRRDTDDADDIASGDFCVTLVVLEDDG